MSSTTQISGVSPLPSTALPAADGAGYKVVGARHPGRLAGTIFAVIVIALTLHSILDNPHWGWPVFAHWFFSRPVLQGLGRTLELTLVASVCGFVLGTALALARLSRSPLLAGAGMGLYLAAALDPAARAAAHSLQSRLSLRSVTLGIPFTDIVFASCNHRPAQPVRCGGARPEPEPGGVCGGDHPRRHSVRRSGPTGGGGGARPAAPAADLPHRPAAGHAGHPADRVQRLIGLAKGTSIVYIVAIPELFYTVQVIFHRNLEVIPLLMVATVWYLIILTVLSACSVKSNGISARGALRNRRQRRCSCSALARHARPAGPRSRESAGAAARRRRGHAPGSTLRARQAGGHVAIQQCLEELRRVKVLDNVSLNFRPAASPSSRPVRFGQVDSSAHASIISRRVDEGFISIDGELIGYRQAGTGCTSWRSATFCAGASMSAWCSRASTCSRI